MAINSYDYDIWRNLTPEIEGMSNSFMYAGEVYDKESGLYYLRARYYNPTIGRLINEDTYEGDFTNSLSQANAILETYMKFGRDQFGNNNLYNLISNNCYQATIAALRVGVLDDGTKVGTI